MKIKLFGRTFEIRNSTDALPSIYCGDWAAYLGGKGHVVSQRTAIKVAAVIRCVDVVAKTMASLPLNLYVHKGDSRIKAENHSLHRLLYRLPNPETTSYEFWHMYIFNLMLTIGGFAKIERDYNGFVKYIWNIPTSNAKIHRYTNGERYVQVSLTNGKSEILNEGEFMYTPGLRMFHATDAEDPIKIAADVLGLTMALNNYATDFFENGSNLGGILETPEHLSDESYKKFKDSWQEAYSGVVNHHKVAILEEGVKFTPLGRDPASSQALESRKFEVIEICRMFGVPPHKVFDLDRATFSNIEQQNIEYVQESIAPMAVRLEQTIYKDLLTEREQSKYYAKFNVNALLRGDIAARTAYYHNARQDGWMSADDIRSLEDMNPLPEGQGGDVYAVNGNLIPLSSVKDNLPKGAQKGVTP